METNGNEQQEKTVSTNTVIDSKCQEFSIQFYFPVFMRWIFIIYVMGIVFVWLKEQMKKVYRGERLGVRIVRGIWDEEDWDAVRVWAPVTHKGSDCQALWDAAAFLQIHVCQLPQ